MGLLDTFRGGTVARMPDPSVELAEALDREKATTALLEESIAELELALDDAGWNRMAAIGDVEFSRDGMRKIGALCQLMAIKNPLIKRGLGLRFFYVWGEGVTVTAQANGQNDRNPAEQDVNTVIQDFLDDPGNTAALTGPEAHAQLELILGTEGNLFVALFTNPRTGRVNARLVPFFEVHDVITNPDDRDDPWYYKRVWTRTSVSLNGSLTTSQETTYYPAVGYWPTVRPKAVDGHPVMWDAPIAHAKVNGLPGWKFGLPDAYAAIDWARSYKTFLEDWATLVKALSRFAWRLTAPGSKNAAIRKALAAIPTRDEYTQEPLPTGATALLGPDMGLEAIPKTGATIDSDSGRPLAAMVASGLEVPVTMLLGDPGTTGARATAETLDRPTELMAEARRAVWTGFFKRVLQYVIEQAVLAPQGPLKGTFTRDGNRLLVTLAGDTDATVDIDWPDLDDDVSVDVLVKAITMADQTGKLPPLVVARLLLLALGVPEVDQVLDDLTDDQGQFLDPGMNAGQAAVDAFQRGQDPAAVVGSGPNPEPQAGELDQLDA